MKDDLQQQVMEQTWHEVVFFQLRSIGLPDQYENEIQNTEVKGQDIHTAMAELNRDMVKFVTQVEIANLAVNATLETAYGNGNKTLFEAAAIESTIKDVIEMQVSAFKVMKTDLTFDNNEIMEYLKKNLIKDYGGGRLALVLDGE